MTIRSMDVIIRMPNTDYTENVDIEEKVQGVCIDSKEVVEGNLYVLIHGANNNGYAYIQQATDNGTRAVLRKRREANPPEEVVVVLADDTTAALQQLAEAYRDQLNIEVVGVIGSNGETSTKDILASVPAKYFTMQKTFGNYNNEIGVLLTLLSLLENCEAAVMEMGTESLQELPFLTQTMRPDIAVISNVGTVHLKDLGTMENIAGAKIEVAGGPGEYGLPIYNGNQQLLRNAAIEKRIPGCIKIHASGKDEQNGVVVHQVCQLSDGLCLSIKDQVYHLDMIRKHQAVNATAAWIVARTPGLDEGEIAQGFVNVEKTGLRNGLVRVNQCPILGNSYKFDPQNTLVAVDTAEEFDISYKLAVLGGMLEFREAGDMIHYILDKDINSYHLQGVLTIGDMVCYIAQGARGDMEHTLMRHFIDKEELLNYLRPHIHKECMLLAKGNRGMELDGAMDELVKEQQ